MLAGWFAALISVFIGLLPEWFVGADVRERTKNFVFDQYWNEDVRMGLLLRVTLGRDGTCRLVHSSQRFFAKDDILVMISPGKGVSISKLMI